MSAQPETATEATRLGEVIETGTTGFWAESDRLHDLPELGALVRVRGISGDTAYFGVVAFGQTGGLDPGRRPVRRGAENVVDDAIYAHHPELEFVLRTVFHVAAVGYEVSGRVRHTLPALPAPLHYSVYACTTAEVRAFSADALYFAALMTYTGPIAVEHVLAGHLIWVDRTLDDQHGWLSDATRRLARLMKRDYDRLATILQAVDPD